MLCTVGCSTVTINEHSLTRVEMSRFFFEIKVNLSEYESLDMGMLTEKRSNTTGHRNLSRLYLLFFFRLPLPAVSDFMGVVLEVYQTYSN